MKPPVVVIALLLMLRLHAQTDSVMYVQGFAFNPGIYLSYQQFLSNSPVPKNAVVFEGDSTRLDYLKLALSKDHVQWRDTSGKLQTTKVSSLWGYSENNAVYVRWNYAFNRIVVIGKVCHFTAYQTNYMYTGPGTYPNQQYGTPVESLQQYLLDTETGSILDYNTTNMEAILKRDPVLFAEYSSLKRRQKKDQLFLFLRKYNEKHPLYFSK
jgi:hypothetical protein